MRLMQLNSPKNASQCLPCPVCNADCPLQYRHPEAELHRCSQCDHCFSNPESIVHQEAYGPEYFQEMHRNWFNNPNRGLFRKLHRIIRAHNPSASVLDVGCGNGNLLKYLHEQSPGMRLAGVDICALPTLDGIELRQGDAFELDFGASFDVVISLAVIEHVADVRTFVEKLRRLAKPGGLVIILTVNDRSLTYALARGLRRLNFAGGFNRLYSKHHLNHFNFESLAHLLTAGGLEILQTIRHHSPLAAIDVPANSPIMGKALRTATWALFQLELLTGRTILQTVVCRVPPSSRN